MSRKSLLLVLVQFLSILTLAVSSPLALPLVSLAWIMGGVILGLWALAAMSQSVIRVQPEVARKAKLVKIGPYKYIRHPMYISVILSSIGLLIADLVWWRIIVLVILLDVLRQKSIYEEQLLKDAFKGYKTYAANTKKFIPFFY